MAPWIGSEQRLRLTAPANAVCRGEWGHWGSRGPSLNKVGMRKAGLFERLAGLEHPPTSCEQGAWGPRE
jgi:hypothetical protein